jgi:hypothetical protein
MRPKKPGPTLTLKALYQSITGDLAAHPAAIHARFRKLDAHMQRLANRRMAGQRLREIAAAEGVKHGTVANALRRAMESIRKSIAGEPRYNRVGRKKNEAAPGLPDSTKLNAEPR